MLKRLLLAALLLPGIANAQFNFVNGQVLTATQLNNAFAATLPLAGGILTGPLTVPSLSVTGTPISLASGGTGATTATGSASQFQFQASGTGAVARTYQAKFSDTINVADFGAVGDCTTDDSNAIRKAINADTFGAQIVFNKACYAIGTALTVGNGSNGVQSTQYGVVLVGAGSGANDYTSFNGAGTRLKWTGTAGGTMLTFAGPGGGYGIDGITLDGNNIAAIDLILYSTRNSSWKNFGAINFTGTGVELLTRTGGGVQYGTNNIFENYTVQSTNSSAQYGWFVNGDYANNVDWYRNTWINGITQVTASAAYAGYFEFADHNTFINADFQNTTTFANGVFLNGTSNSAYPQNLFFYGSSISGVGVSGTISPNYFYNFTTKDGEIVPNNPNLFGWTDTGINFNPGITTQADSNYIRTLTQAGTYGWQWLNNNSASSQQNLQLQYTANGGSTWTTYFQIFDYGAVYIPGALQVNGALSVGGVNVAPNLIGTTASIGGSALAAGACTSGTVAVTGSTTSMAVVATPATYPGDGIFWHGYVSTAGTVTVKVCASIAATPTASAYNVRVLQ
jgi:hypothetical protein